MPPIGFRPHYLNTKAFTLTFRLAVKCTEFVCWKFYAFSALLLSSKIINWKIINHNERKAASKKEEAKEGEVGLLDLLFWIKLHIIETIIVNIPFHRTKKDPTNSKGKVWSDYLILISIFINESSQKNLTP